MKKWEILNACRQGRIDHNAKGSITVQLDLTEHRIRHSNTMLLNDLIRELQRIANQMENSYENGSYWVPALDTPTNLLSFFTIFPLTKEEPASDCDAPVDINSKMPSMESDIHTMPEQHFSVNTESDFPKNENSNTVDVEVRTIETAATTTSSCGKSDLVKTNTPLQTSFPLNVQESEGSRNQATLIALDTLNLYYADQISSYDEVNARIEASPLPDVTRNFVYTALPSWKTTATSGAIIKWPLNGGIKHLLPLEQSVGLRIRIHTLGDSVDGKYTGRVTIEHIPHIKNISLIKFNLRDYDRTLELDILTADIFDKLNLAWSLHLTINIAVSVEKFINQSRKAIFTVIQAFCQRPENFDAENALRITDALFDQPDEVDLWATGE